MKSEEIIRKFVAALQKHGVDMQLRVPANQSALADYHDFEYDNEMEDFIQQYVKENYPC